MKVKYNVHIFSVIFENNEFYTLLVENNEIISWEISNTNTYIDKKYVGKRAYNVYKSEVTINKIGVDEFYNSLLKERDNLSIRLLALNKLINAYEK